MTIKYTESPFNIPNGNKIYQMAITYIYQNIYQKYQNGYKIYQRFTLQDPPKFTQIGIWGLKMYHLATLIKVNLNNKKRKKAFQRQFLIASFFLKRTKLTYINNWLTDIY
jgi:hypothetical protein